MTLKTSKIQCGFNSFISLTPSLPCWIPIYHIESAISNSANLTLYLTTQNTPKVSIGRQIVDFPRTRSARLEPNPKF